jgi:hypothetical protein
VRFISLARLDWRSAGSFKRRVAASIVLDRAGRESTARQEPRFQPSNQGMGTQRLGADKDSSLSAPNLWVFFRGFMEGAIQDPRAGWPTMRWLASFSA